MDKLAHGWFITDRASYFFVGLVLQLAIRAFMSLLSAWRLTRQASSKERFHVHFGRSLIGLHPGDTDQNETSDYSLPLILGLIEHTAIL